MLVDPAVVTGDAAAKWRSRFPHLVKAWVWQDKCRSDISAIVSLSSQVWSALDSAGNGAILVAVGGGTTLDIAKVLRWRMPDGVSVAGELRANTVPAGSVRCPLVLWPTTAGTGSEVTPWATLWDLDTPEPTKLSWHPVDGFAEQAWVDPQLAVGCPLGVTRDTGLDALAHALESLWNRRANVASRALSRTAARDILVSLPKLLASPGDTALRAVMAEAALLAGMAMAQTQTALAHALSYPLTVGEGMPHGHACAVWLPMVADMALESGVATVQQDLHAVFGEMGRPDAALRVWLQALGVVPRDIRHSTEGRRALGKAMRQSRGENFVGIGNGV
jgi:alcohol dehydrogenase